jgi:hypothetical protein
MSVVYCEICDKMVDLDFDAEHFDQHIDPEVCLFNTKYDDEDWSGASDDNSDR